MSHTARSRAQEKVASLLHEGLELYGTGEVARAFLVWSEVLEIDPGNEEALDYMRDADRRAKARGDEDSPGRSIVDHARRILHAEGPDAAFELLKSAPAGGCFESEAMIELLRATLYRRDREALGDLRQVPQVVGEPGDVQSRNLPPSAGFLLSMVDGQMTIADLVSVSGMDRFEALRSIHRMQAAGILEWSA